MKQEGFTLIELLVVVAIIGLLTSIIIISMGNARIKGRDGKRLSDIQQIKSGMEIYYSNGSGYPDKAVYDAAINGQLNCSGQFVMTVPQDPLTPANPAFAYVYNHGGNSGSGCGVITYSNYKVQFQTEGQTSLGPAGTYYLSPSGITVTPPF